MTNCPDCGESMRVGYGHMCEVINNYPDIPPTANISNAELLLLLRNYLNEVKLLEEKYGMTINQLKDLLGYL